MIKADSLRADQCEAILHDDCPSFSGIIAGECKGDVWVDAIDTPRIAIVYSYAAGGFAFLGCPLWEDQNMKLREYIYRDIFDFLKQKGIGYFEYSIESTGLKPYIQKMFQDKDMQSETEYSYRITKSIQANNTLPAGFKMQRIDSDLWSHIIHGEYANESFVTERLLESWDSFNTFEKKSVGYCITYFDAIAAVSIGTARYENIIPVDIETAEAFKNKGLGYSLTIAFVNECMQRGLIAQWDCVESNPISRRLAEKAGFRLHRENEVFWFGI